MVAHSRWQSKTRAEIQDNMRKSTKDRLGLYKLYKCSEDDIEYHIHIYIMATKNETKAPRDTCACKTAGIQVSCREDERNAYIGQADPDCRGV